MNDKPIRRKPIPYCPDCGGQMILREPGSSQNWESFWGCSQYPDCRGTRQIMEDGRPEDDDDIEPIGLWE